jgi:hypothetical protein
MLSGFLTYFPRGLSLFSVDSLVVSVSVFVVVALAACGVTLYVVFSCVFFCCCFVFCVVISIVY